MDTEITRSVDEHGRGRYTLLVDGRPGGELLFRTQYGRRVFTHTGVRDEHEGQGFAGKLARLALDDARAEGLLVVPLCPFVAGYLEKHPDDQDLIDRELFARLRP